MVDSNHKSRFLTKTWFCEDSQKVKMDSWKSQLEPKSIYLFWIVFYYFRTKLMNTTLQWWSCFVSWLFYRYLHTIWWILEGQEELDWKRVVFEASICIYKVLCLSFLPSMDTNYKKLAHSCAKHSLERKGTIVPLLSSFLKKASYVYGVNKIFKISKLPFKSKLKSWTKGWMQEFLYN